MSVRLLETESEAFIQSLKDEYAHIVSGAPGDRHVNRHKSVAKAKMNYYKNRFIPIAASAMLVSALVYRSNGNFRELATF